MPRQGARRLPIIILSGRPYHLDPEINHGIDKLITSLGAAVISEDVVSNHVQKFRTRRAQPVDVPRAALRGGPICVRDKPDMNLVQLVSFGCGVDAITTDEVREHSGRRTIKFTRRSKSMKSQISAR